MTSKDKYYVTLQSTSKGSDDEEIKMSSTSYKCTTEMGICNPTYDAGADSSDTEFSRSEDALKSEERGKRCRVSGIRVR